MIGEYHNHWEEHVHLVCMAYNTSIQSTTGYSPFYLMFGIQARLPIDIMYGAHISAPTDVYQYAQEILAGSIQQRLKEFPPEAVPAKGVL